MRYLAALLFMATPAVAGELPAIDDQNRRFLAIGRVQNAGRTLTVCTGEVRAYAGDGDAHKVVALMQATIVTVPA